MWFVFSGPQASKGFTKMGYLLYFMNHCLTFASHIYPEFSMPSTLFPIFFELHGWVFGIHVAVPYIYVALYSLQSTFMTLSRLRILPKFLLGTGQSSGDVVENYRATGSALLEAMICPY